MNVFVFSHVLNDLWVRGVELSLSMAMGVVVFLCFSMLSVVLPRVLFGVTKKAGKSRQHVYKIVGRTIRLVTLVVGAITALATAGLNVSALVASLGLTGFALGFALKDSLSNVLAGFIIIFYHPFKIGEDISVSGKEGVVIDMDLRYTTLQGKGQRILVPNSSMLSSIVTIHDSAAAVDVNT